MSAFPRFCDCPDLVVIHRADDQQGVTALRCLGCVRVFPALRRRETWTQRASETYDNYKVRLMGYWARVYLPAHSE